MIEREKETRGDPEPEARAWAAQFVEAERKPEKYQEMFVVDAMTLDKFRPRLDALEETLETARCELEALRNWSECLETLERDKERLLESYATLAPEALEALESEERRTVYSMLELHVEALPGRSSKIRGASGEENLFWESEERQDVPSLKQTLRPVRPSGLP